MRVLIYVEPHPIRGTQKAFDGVARSFLPLLSSSTPEFDVRMYSTESIVDELGPNAWAGIEQRIIRATSSEEALFKHHLVSWETLGIPAWLDLMAGGATADGYVDVLRRVWSVFPFDVIVHWGENGAVTRFVEGRPVTRIAMELGCTRAPFLPSVVLDPFGTNGSGIVPRLTVADLDAIVEGNPMTADEALYGYSESIEAKLYEEQFLPVHADLSVDLLKAEGKIAFLPLQLHDDANLLRFSPYETVEDVVVDVVPRLAAAGYTTIVKAHPASKIRRNSHVANAIARAALRPWADKVVWLDGSAANTPNAQLIALADLVVTVNSSVGFEALYFDKVVAIMGDAVYKPQGLFPSLDEAIAGDFDHGAYLRGIGLLRRFMLGGYLTPDSARSDFSSFRSAAATLDALRRRHGDNPALIAKGMYQSVSLARENRVRLSMVRGGSVPGRSEFGVPKPAVPAHKAEMGEAQSGARDEYTVHARKLLAHYEAESVEEFRMSLEADFAQPTSAEDAVRVAGLVDEAYYLARYADVARRKMDPAYHWARFGIHEGRRPRGGISAKDAVEVIERLVAAAESTIGRSLIPSFPLGDDDEARRQNALATIRAGLGRHGHRVAVVAHLYYRDVVPEVLERLGDIPEGFDLIVTMPDWGNRETVDLVRAAYPDALFYPASNRGRDIGPFVDVLPALLEQRYDTVLKLQTKRGYFRAGRLVPELGEHWRRSTFEALLGSREIAAANIAAFRSDAGLNMVGPADYLLPLSRYPYQDGGELAESVLGDAVGTDEGGFIAGTMFWVRPECLAPLVRAGLSLESFAPETGANDGAVAHLVERLFGQLALVDGRLATVDAEGTLSQEAVPLTISIDELITQRWAEREAAANAASKGGALMW